MKLAVIGGGGIRSMFLAKALVQKAEQVNITHIVFMDNDENKLNIFGKMAKHVAQKINKNIEFTLTTDPVEAVKDASYVITTIRVGGDSKRVEDERAALDENILGQETTGAAGFSFAMRSIPALAKYLDLMRQYSKPDVKVFNFTNPAGIVSQALRDMGYDFTFGICDAPSGLIRQCAQIYGSKPEDVVANCYGLNHLSFFNSFKLNGREILPELLDNDKLYTETEMVYFTKDIAKYMGGLINEYLYYFFYREKAVENILSAGVTRGEVIRDINIQMIKELEQIDIENDFDRALAIFEKWYDKRESAYMSNETGHKRNRDAFKFDIYSEDTGGYAGVALQYIQAAQTGVPVNMVLCVPNDGAIPDLNDSDVVEVTCTITKDGYIAHKTESVGELQMELIKRVKYYERKGAQAIVNGDKTAAIEALMMHPLVNSYSLAQKMVDKFQIINDGYMKLR